MSGSQLSSEETAGYARRAEALGEVLADPERTWAWPELAHTLAARGDACRHAGRIAESEEAFRRLRGEAERRDDIRALSSARLGLANALCARSRWADAIAEIVEILPLTIRSGDRLLDARARCVLASAHFNRGELEPAASLLREALVTAREYEDQSIGAPALVSLGVIALARGEVHEAYARVSEGLALAERNRDEHWAAMARSYLAIQAHLCGRHAAAERTYDQSATELEGLGLRRALGLCQLARATLRMCFGHWSEAHDMLERAVGALSATCPDYESIWQAALAICDLAGGDVAGFRHRLEYADALVSAGDGAPSWFAIRAPIVARVRALDRDRPPRPEAGQPAPSIELTLIDRACAELERRAVAPSLVLDEELRRFRVPASTQIADLSRRAPLRRLLALLVARHRDERGAYVSDRELIAAGWPDEAIAARAANNRLHNAISTLRGMGLRDWIEWAGAGYRLRPDLVVRTVAGHPDELRSDP